MLDLPTLEMIDATPRKKLIAEIAAQMSLHFLDELQVVLEKSVRSCMTCQRFNEQWEQCNVCQARPPAKVIAYGCPQYIDVQEIPY